MTTQPLKEHPLEWAWRGAALLLLVANLWLNSHYVRIEDFQKYQDAQAAQAAAETKSFSELREAIIKITDHLQTDVRQDNELQDHEMRLRTLESRVPIGIGEHLEK